MASRVCPIKTALSMRGLLVYDRYDHKSTLLERGLPVYDQDIQVYVYIKITSVITGNEITRRLDTVLISAEPTGGVGAPRITRYCIDYRR